MTWIEGAWTEFPERRFAQEELAEYLPRWLPPERLGFARQVFRRSRVDSRHLAISPEELVSRGRSFASKNDLYKASVHGLVERLCAGIQDRVDAARLASVDLLITASCTGFQIPAIDALVVPALGLSASVRRLNLTQHGCAAGAAALGLSHEWLAAHPDRRALVVCVELGSLAFQPEDVSDENIVSGAIFGDGSAAVLVAGADAIPAPRRALSIRGAYRELFPHTEHFMGFEVNDAGLKIKLSRDVVPFAQRELGAVFDRACQRWGVSSPTAFRIGSVHPGGRRILEVLEEEVGLATPVTRTSWECLARYGNMSSVSVLASLERLIQSGDGEPGSVGLLSAFGPGFGAELALLERAA